MKAKRLTIKAISAEVKANTYRLERIERLVLRLNLTMLEVRSNLGIKTPADAAREIRAERLKQISRRLYGRPKTLPQT